MCREHPSLRFGCGKIHCAAGARSGCLPRVIHGRAAHRTSIGAGYDDTKRLFAWNLFTSLQGYHRRARHRRRRRDPQTTPCEASQNRGHDDDRRGAIAQRDRGEQASECRDFPCAPPLKSPPLQTSRGRARRTGPAALGNSRAPARASSAMQPYPTAIGRARRGLHQLECSEVLLVARVEARVAVA